MVMGTWSTTTAIMIMPRTARMISRFRTRRCNREYSTTEKPVTMRTQPKHMRAATGKASDLASLSTTHFWSTAAKLFRKMPHVASSTLQKYSPRHFRLKVLKMKKWISMMLNQVTARKAASVRSLAQTDPAGTLSGLRFILIRSQVS